MGIFDFFKKPLIVEDDFFGRLRFMKIKNNPSRNYFEGKGKFGPTGRELEYFIHADESGPEPEQKEFYRQIQQDWPRIVEKIKPLIEAEFRNWKDDFTITDFNREFHLVGLTIPRPEIQPREWDLAFDTIHDENHQFTVYLKGYEPTRVEIDG